MEDINKLSNDFSFKFGILIKNYALLTEGDEIKNFDLEVETAITVTWELISHPLITKEERRKLLIIAEILKNIFEKKDYNPSYLNALNKLVQEIHVMLKTRVDSTFH